MTDLVTLVEGARARMEANEPFHAELHYRQILRLTEPPKTAVDRMARGEAAAFFARRALYRNRIGEAGDWYKLATDADPTSGDLRAELVQKVLLPLGMIDSARIEAKRATELEPDSLKAWTALGDVEYQAGNAEASLQARKQAVALAPQDPFLLLKLATLHLDTANYEAVDEICALVLAQHPERRADAIYLQAAVAYRRGQHEDSARLYGVAIAAGCASPDEARFNRALALHSLGRYPEGWFDYEARGLGNAAWAAPFKRFAAPIWQGEPAPARLHLHEEMGYGDTLAMARYAPILAERGYDVRMEVRPELVDLFRRSFPGVTIARRALDYPGAVGLQPFDYHVPMLSLPHILGTTVETIPWSGPYLKADPAKVAAYDAMLPKGLRIGLCWSSGIRDGLWLREYGLRKSMPLRQMEPLLRAVAADWICLQIGPEAAEADLIGVEVYLDEHSTWDDTAALVECLDLVISVDTALAHMVGALGKPVWLLQHCEGSWHYMADIDGAPWQHKSPWYPNTKLYRQQRPHEWDQVIVRIAADLRKLA